MAGMVRGILARGVYVVRRSAGSCEILRFTQDGKGAPRQASCPPTPSGSYLRGLIPLKLPGRVLGGCVSVVSVCEAGVDVLDDLVAHGGEGEHL